jgi:hypothetical protein
MKGPKCICDDCGVDIRKAGEYLMLSPEIWDEALGLGWGDNLCIGCVEKRLGRRIGPGLCPDIVNIQRCGSMSTRLQVRLFGHCITKRKPYRFYASVRDGFSGFTKKMLADIAAARDAGV